MNETQPQPLPTDAPTIDVMIHDLRGLYQQTTRGTWGKGRSY